jgi:hypothetical protein
MAFLTPGYRASLHPTHRLGDSSVSTLTTKRMFFASLIYPFIYAIASVHQFFFFFARTALGFQPLKDKAALSKFGTEARKGVNGVYL